MKRMKPARVKTASATGTAASGERPVRWTSRPAGRRDVEDRVAALVRASEEPDGLGAAAHARVWSRLAGTERHWRPLGALRWSVAASVLLASAGVVAGVTARKWWPTSRGPALAPAELDGKARAPRLHRGGTGRVAAATLPEEARPPIAEARVEAPPIAPPPSPAAPIDREAEPVRAGAPRARRPPAVPPIAEATDSAPAVAPPPVPGPALDAPAPALAHTATPAPAAAAPAAATPRPTATSTAAALPALTGGATAALVPAPPARPPSALALETSGLGDALTLLRQRHDAVGALAALDAYDARFPRGTLHREATIARVDALLLLGKDDQALAALRTLALQPRGRDQELRVIRGELAAPSSCRAAVADFDRALTEAPPTPLVERALHGRAVCLARLGDAAAATRDFRDYLRRFPDGRFAAEARRGVGENDL